MPQRAIVSFQFSVLDTTSGTLEGRVSSGGSAGSAAIKAYVALFKYYDKNGQFIPGPYANLSHSKLGSYKYLGGGSKDNPKPFILNTIFPANAQKLTVDFISWATSDEIVFDGDLLTGPTLARLNADGTTVAATAEKPSLTAQTAHDAQQLAVFKNCHPCDFFAGEDSFRLRKSKKADAMIALGDAPLWVDIPADGLAEFAFLPKVRTATKNATKDALIRIVYLDAQGNDMAYAGDDLTRSGSVGLYKYLPAYPDPARAAVRLFVPAGCHTLRIGFQRWKATHDVSLGNDIPCAALRTGISVVIPCYKGEDYIDRCLQSIAAQTLPAGLFETLVVLNGPADSSALKIDHFRKLHPQLSITTVLHSHASAGGARNAGVALAAHQYIAYLDVDDTIAPRYLEELLAHADISRVAVTAIHDVHEDGQTDTNTSLNAQILGSPRAMPLTTHDVSSAITMNASKIFPTYYARQIRFDEHLKSGEDVCYFTGLFTRFSLQCTVCRGAETAPYLRHVVDDSVSRKPVSFDFNVLQRLAVIRQLDQLLRLYPHSEQDGFIRAKIRSQLGFIGRYCAAHPKEYAHVISCVRNAYFSYAPLDIINAQAAKTLVISYCFPPYSDTSSIVMAKRAAALDVPFDALFNRLDGMRHKDASLRKFIQTRIGETFEIASPPTFTNWPAMQQFSTMALEKILKVEAQKGAYESVYSRAMWPASHFAAAAFKAARPDIKWTAEFSDPLLYDIKSAERRIPLDRAWLEKTGILKLLHECRLPVPDDDNLYLWCEILPYALADSLVFTNDNQLSYMASYCPVPELRNIMPAKAVVRKQPTPPADFYHFSASDYFIDPSYVHLAFFRSVYETRGLEDLFAALAALPEKIKSKIRLHIFSQQYKQMLDDITRLGLQDTVVLNQYVEYFEHLNLLTRFDVLVLNDAATQGIKSVNPYLPSKLSDYLGSGTRIWGITEDGSSLSQSKNLTYTSPLGSAKGYAATLKAIVKDMDKH